MVRRFDGRTALAGGGTFGRVASGRNLICLEDDEETRNRRARMKENCHPFLHKRMSRRIFLGVAPSSFGYG